MMNDGMNPDSHRFRRQWVILSADDPFQFDWNSHRFSTGEVLYWHPDAQVEIHRSGRKELIIIGLLVAMSQSEGLVSSQDAEEFWKSPETWLVDAAGTYAVIAHDGTTLEIFTDPGALMGVYHSDGRASTSPSLLPGLTRDREIDRQYTLDVANDWYTGSICPFEDVRFLAANHRLLLSTGEIRRFWPKQIAQIGTDKESVDCCSELVSDVVRKLGHRGRLLVSLTGGRDSRVNLAACRSMLDQVEFFTIRSPLVARCDLEIPARLASRHQEMRHHIVDDVPSDAWVTELYDEVSAGMAVGARREILGACRMVSRLGDIHLSGALGEMSRAYFWHTKHPEAVRLDAALSKFRNPAACVREGLEEWLASAPSGLPPSALYNLMYLEQRGGRWAGVGENAASIFYHPFSAFNSRLFYEALCRVPEELQHGNRLPIEMIRRMWPSLLDVPFCRPGGAIGSLLPKSAKNFLKKLLPH